MFGVIPFVKSFQKMSGIYLYIYVYNPVNIHEDSLTCTLPKVTGILITTLWNEL